jgi:hypothetical protein
MEIDKISLIHRYTYVGDGGMVVESVVERKHDKKDEREFVVARIFDVTLH